MNIFVISDIHGMYKKFEQALMFWDTSNKLVLLGDLIDRGPQSFEVVQKAISLQKQYGQQFLFIKGNHEQLLLDFIEQPEEKLDYYFVRGGRETMQSFVEHCPPHVQHLSSIEQAYFVKEQFADMLSFLQDAPLHTVIGDVLFTHGGFDSNHIDYTETTAQDFIWIRKHYLIENKTPYINIFGHTPTKYIHKRDDVWLSEDKKYIAIDGGCVFGGQLNAVLLNPQGQLLHVYCVQSDAPRL